MVSGDHQNRKAIRIRDRSTMTPEVAKYRWLIHLQWAAAFAFLVWASWSGFRLYIGFERYKFDAQEPRVITVPCPAHIGAIAPKGGRK